MIEREALREHIMPRDDGDALNTSDNDYVNDRNYYNFEYNLFYIKMLVFFFIILLAILTILY